MMRKNKTHKFALPLACAAALLAACAANPGGAGENGRAEEAPIKSDRLCISGVYPHMAYWNDEGECGTGAVVPWAGKLWAVTYGPHCVFESSRHTARRNARKADGQRPPHWRPRG